MASQDETIPLIAGYTVPNRLPILNMDIEEDETDETDENTIESVEIDNVENESQEVIFRLISDILVKVSKKYYSPRGKDVVNLISKIQSKGFKRLTLGGCIVEKVYDLLIFRKEFEF